MREVLDALRRRRAEAVRQLADLEGLRARIVEASSDDNADDEHDPEGATIAWDREQTTALIESTRVQLQAIDAAMSRIVQGWDGSCAQCRRPIGHQRLLARPETDLCIICAERAARRR